MSSTPWVSSLGNTLTGDTTNPFANVNVAASLAVAPSPNPIGSKEDKSSMMAAFSDLGLALDTVTSSKTPSSAKALLAKKESERLQEEQADADQRARREARLAAQRKAQAQSAPPSALTQALDAFAGEVSQSDAFSSALSNRKTGASGVVTGSARRARQQQEKAVRSGKSVRDIKRHQRRDRHVY